MTRKQKSFRRSLSFVTSFSLLLQTWLPVLTVLPNYSYAQAVPVEIVEPVTPTVSPANEPVVEPTSVPTEQPVEPTAVPTAEPTQEVVPTEVPPIITPTAQPSIDPSPSDPPAVPTGGDSPPGSLPADIPADGSADLITPTIEPILSITPIPTEATPVEQICLTDEQIVDSTGANWNIDLEKGITETKEKVKLGIKYNFPLENKVSVTFKCLPKDEGLRTNLKIEQVKVADLKLPEGVNPSTEYAYDITTGMNDGDFEYDVTLPKPEGQTAEINYIEKSINDAKLNEVNTNEIKQIEGNTIEQVGETVKAIGVNHFSIYFTSATVKISGIVNGVSQITVSPGTSVIVSLNVRLGQGDWWKGSAWSTNNINWNCVDTPNHKDNNPSGDSSFSENFTITAPGSNGTYTLYIRASKKDDCTWEYDSGTLPNAIIVATPTSTPTPTNTPLPTSTPTPQLQCEQDVWSCEECQVKPDGVCGDAQEDYCEDNHDCEYKCTFWLPFIGCVGREWQCDDTCTTPIVTPTPTLEPQCKHENAECDINASEKECCDGLDCVLFNPVSENYKCQAVSTPTPTATSTPIPTATPTPVCETTSWTCDQCQVGPSQDPVCYGQIWTYCKDNYGCDALQVPVAGIWSCPSSCVTPTPTITPEPTVTPTIKPACGDRIRDITEECDGTDGVGVNQFCTSSCKLINVYTGDRECSQGKQPVLVQGPINISATNTSGQTPVTVTLPNVSEYLFEATGTYGYGGDYPNNTINRADAGYATGDVWGTRRDDLLGIPATAYYRGITSLLSDMGTGTIGIVDWGNYDSTHNYKINYTPTISGTNVNFVISDWYDTWYSGDAASDINKNQGGLWDNEGGLSLNVYECQNQEGTITVKKYLDPRDNNGLFNLSIDDQIVVSDVGHDGTTGQVILPVGNHSVSESPGTGTDSSHYSTSVDCIDQKTGQSVIGGSQGVTSVSGISLTAGQDIVCVFTNTVLPYCGDGITNGTEECDGQPNVLAYADIGNPPTFRCSPTCKKIWQYGGSDSCPAGTIEKLVTTADISSTDHDGEILSLTAGKSYLFRASGTFVPTCYNQSCSIGWYSDAGYTTGDNWANLLTQYGIHGTGSDYAAHALLGDLGDGVGVISWGPYQTSHVYNFYRQVNTSSPQFVIGDRYDDWFVTSWQNQIGMRDNNGSLKLEVFECEPTTDVTVCKNDTAGNSLSGWQMVLREETALQTKFVPATDGSTVVTDSVPAGDYILRADGQYTYRPGTAGAEYSDAGWSKRHPNDSVYGGDYAPWVKVATFSPHTGWLGVKVNDDNADWGNYFNPSHIYAKGFAGFAGGTWSLKILDDVYSDNSDGVNVGVYRGYTGLTGDDGCITFSDVNLGNYTVEEIERDGWTKQSGGGNINVDGQQGTITFINSRNPYCGDGVVNQNSEQCDDGNSVNGDGCSASCQTEFGSISGTKWNDLDGDGQKDPGEPGVTHTDVAGGVTIYLDLDNDGQQEQGEPSTNTDNDGHYGFDNIASGRYVVCERDDLLTGWIRTYPISNNCHGIFVNPGENLTDINFGNFKLGSILGRKYEDLNRDGTRDAGEAYLNDWTIRIYLRKTDGSWFNMDNRQTGHTGIIGQYKTEGLTLGRYKICEVLQPGWTQTSPTGVANNVQPDEASRCRIVDITQSGQELTGRHFGNIQYGSIKITKNTTEGDDTFNFTTTGGGGLPPEFNLTTTGTTVDVTYPNIIPGTFSISETAKSGWDLTGATCTGDPNPSQEVTVSPGENVECTFTNTPNGTVHGYKWEDTDMSGGPSSGLGEDLLSGWTINLYKWNGAEYDSTPVRSMVTDNGSDHYGWYWFENLLSGQYKVCEELQGGWVQTYPINENGNCHILNLPDDNSNGFPEMLNAVAGPEYNFGNFENGTLYVDKYEDTDGVLGQSGSEELIGDPTFTFRVYKTTNNPWVLMGEQNTDTSGRATFNGIFNEIGSYMVCEVKKTEWEEIRSLNNSANNQSGAIDEYPVCEGITVSSSDYQVYTKFGNIHKGEITVYKFEDLNANGTHEDGEPYLSDWDMVMNQVSGSGNTQKTDEAGKTTFSLNPGDYVLGENLQEGWLQSGIYCEESQIVPDGVRVTALGEAYGHHGVCEGWNGCGDAATCALWACEVNGYDQLVSYGETKPCTEFNDCNLFNSRGSIDMNWVIHCPVMRVTDIYCGNNTTPTATPTPRGVSEISLFEEVFGIKNAYAQPAPDTNTIPVTVSPGDKRTCYVGNYRPASVGDFVWKDINDDNIQDVGEPGINGVTVRLYRDDGDSSFNASLDTLVSTTTTGSDGKYLFGLLPVGKYFIEADQTTLPDGGVGYSLSVGGVNPRGLVTLSAGENNLDQDFGFAPPLTLQLAKSNNKPFAAVGDLVEYTLQIKTGERDLSSMTLIDNLPEGFVYQTGTASINLGTYTSAEPVLTNTDKTMTWTWTYVPHDSIVTIKYTIKIESANQAAAYTNYAYVYGSGSPTTVETDIVESVVKINPLLAYSTTAGTTSTVLGSSTTASSVLGASLPAAGANTWYLILALSLIGAGFGVKSGKFKFKKS